MDETFINPRQKVVAWLTPLGLERVIYVIQDEHLGPIHFVIQIGPEGINYCDTMLNVMYVLRTAAVNNRESIDDYLIRANLELEKDEPANGI